MVEGDQPAEDRLLPDRQADAVPELQRERRFLVGEPELRRGRPDLGHVGGRGAGTHARDRRVEVVTAALVGVDEGR